jgi:hypothetical protein
MWFDEAMSIDRAMMASIVYGPGVTNGSGRIHPGNYFDRGDGAGFTDKPLEVGKWPRAMLTIKEEPK